MRAEAVPRELPVLARHWVCRYSDDVAGNGHKCCHSVTVLENGDRIFARSDSSTHNLVDGSDSKNGSRIAVSWIAGGNRTFHAIRSTLRHTCAFDPAHEYINGRTEGDYWFDE